MNWTDAKKYPLASVDAGPVVKLWNNGHMWAGHYDGSAKMSNCDWYCLLPRLP